MEHIRVDIDVPKKKVRQNLSIGKLYKMLFHVWRQFDDQYYAGFAAQIAYFFFMASVPTLIVITQVMGLFDVSLDFIQEWISKHLDASIANMAMGLFDASSVTGTNVLMTVLALWAASSLVFSLARLTSYTLSEGRYRFNFFEERFLAIPTALLAIVAIAFTLVIYVYGEELLVRVFGPVLIVKIVLALKGPVLAMLFFMMILVSYYILPRIRVPFRSIIPGSIFATIGIVLVSKLYAIYIDNIANYNIIYGSFTNIVAMMLWFYLISWVICIGMMFNKAYDDVMERDRLTQHRIKEYLRQASRKNDHIFLNKYIDEEGIERDEYASIAEKASCLLVPGYKEELEEKKRNAMRRYL